MTQNISIQNRLVQDNYATTTEKLDIVKSEHNDLTEALSKIAEDLGRCIEMQRMTLKILRAEVEEFDALETGASDIDNGVNQLLAQVNDSSKESKRMRELSSKIGHILNKIVRIADQTNLLSLNAKIEAVKAGSHGQSFSVVANEVKELSQETKTTAESVSQILEEIESATISVDDSMTTSSRLCRNLANSISSVYDRVRQINIQNTSAIDHLFELDSYVFVSLAKLDHVIWKVATYASILNEKQTFPFVSHHDCRLGEWYYEGDGCKAFASLSEFGRLEEPHVKVHEGTKDIFEYIKSPGGIRQLREAINKMEEGSRGVFLVLDALLRAKSRRSET